MICVGYFLLFVIVLAFVFDFRLFAVLIVVVVLTAGLGKPDCLVNSIRSKLQRSWPATQWQVLEFRDG